MLIEKLYFRPDEQMGPDFSLAHIRDVKKHDAIGYEQFVNTRKQILEVMESPDLRSISERLKEMDNQSAEWQEINDQLCVQMCRKHGAELSPALATEMVQQSMQTVVGALDRFTNPDTGLLSEQASIVGQMSGPQEHADPLMLLKIITSPDSYTRVVRFEAARKWELAQESLAIHLGESRALQSLVVLTDIFNQHIWNGDKIGTTESVECISKHDPANFQCVEVAFMGGADKATLDEYSFYHRLRMRRTPGGTLAMWEHRVKSPEDRLLKLMRRRQENPEYDLKDMLDAIGMRLVFKNKNDVLEFEQFFESILEKAGYRTEKIEKEDTLFGQNPLGKPEMVKTVYNLSGITFEMQLLTLPTYFDYYTKDAVSHFEYRLARVVKQAVVLFPHSIYGLDIPRIIADAATMQRENKPNSWRALPSKRSTLKLEQKPFGRRRQEKGANKILSQIQKSNWQPEWIVAETSAATLSQLLTQKLKCPVILIDPKDKKSPVFTLKGEGLLVVNVSHTGATLNRMQEMFTGSKTAALVSQNGARVDYCAEVEPDGYIWYQFS